MIAKSADQWFQEYGESHQNPTNKTIHWICVPAITACVIAFLWDVPRPEFMQPYPYLNWATITLALSTLFYLRLSLSLAVGMLAFSALIIMAIVSYYRVWPDTPVWQVALVVFVIAWIGQFIGHKIEGKKPSFFQDLQFLMIGPIWLLGFLYRKVGIPY